MGSASIRGSQKTVERQGKLWGVAGCRTKQPVSRSTAAAAGRSLVSSPNLLFDNYFAPRLTRVYNCFLLRHALFHNYFLLKPMYVHNRFLPTSMHADSCFVLRLASENHRVHWPVPADISFVPRPVPADIWFVPWPVPADIWFAPGPVPARISFALRLVPDCISLAYQVPADLCVAPRRPLLSFPLQPPAPLCAVLRHKLSSSALRPQQLFVVVPPLPPELVLMIPMCPVVCAQNNVFHCLDQGYSCLAVSR